MPHRVVVHNVDGLEPGVYRWPDLSSRRDTASCATSSTVSAWSRDSVEAAFVVIGATEVDALDDRSYREAQLAAGMVEGRLHLAAYSLGAGATGMTFLDSEIDALWTSRSTRCSSPVSACPSTIGDGGQPGAPTEVRLVVPRTS